VGTTAEHVDVSLCDVVPGQRDRVLDRDRGALRGVRWFQRDAAPLGQADTRKGRFLAKLAG
jgi:hypothetical protein